MALDEPRFFEKGCDMLKRFFGLFSGRQLSISSGLGEKSPRQKASKLALLNKRPQGFLTKGRETLFEGLESRCVPSVTVGAVEYGTCTVSVEGRAPTAIYVEVLPSGQTTLTANQGRSQTTVNLGHGVSTVYVSGDDGLSNITVVTKNAWFTNLWVSLSGGGGKNKLSLETDGPGAVWGGDGPDTIRVVSRGYASYPEVMAYGNDGNDNIIGSDGTYMNGGNGKNTLTIEGSGAKFSSLTSSGTDKVVVKTVGPTDVYLSGQTASVLSRSSKINVVIPPHFVGEVKWSGQAPAQTVAYTDGKELSPSVLKILKASKWSTVMVVDPNSGWKG